MLLVGCVAGIIRAFIVHPPGVLFGIAWAILAMAFVWVSALIVRDLWRQKDLGVYEDQFTATVEPDGVVLLSMRPQSK